MSCQHPSSLLFQFFAQLWQSIRTNKLISVFQLTLSLWSFYFKFFFTSFWIYLRPPTHFQVHVLRIISVTVDSNRWDSLWLANFQHTLQSNLGLYTLPTTLFSYSFFLFFFFLFLFFIFIWKSHYHTYFTPFIIIIIITSFFFLFVCYRSSNWPIKETQSSSSSSSIKSPFLSLFTHLKWLSLTKVCSSTWNPLPLYFFNHLLFVFFFFKTFFFLFQFGLFSFKILKIKSFVRFL